MNHWSQTFPLVFKRNNHHHCELLLATISHHETLSEMSKACQCNGHCLLCINYIHSSLKLMEQFHGLLCSKMGISLPPSGISHPQQHKLPKAILPAHNNLQRPLAAAKSHRLMHNVLELLTDNRSRDTLNGSVCV